MLDDTLGRYRILESIGRGGMGQVFLAEDPALGRRVAIKVLPAEYAADPEREARLRREAQAASALNHPNIVTIYDFGTARGGPYVVMEYVEGETLDEWGRAATRSPLEVLGLLRQATRAMARAHEAGLVHRDLKPKNLMVRRDGLLKILDFGLARSLGPDAASGTALTAAGRILGTARYMSPEQALGQQPGPPSDVFSLGIILYELLTGRHPFTTGSDLVAIHGILHDSPPPPSRANPALTGTVDFVLAKVLSKDPHRRHSSAHELDVDLEALERSYQAPHSAAAVGAPAPSVLAVLPFKDIGGDFELSYLGVGLPDAVITRLAHSPDLIVRTTSSILP
jgi:serine/threonine protein kinase